MMKYIFYHIFYRVYCWNIKVLKEKDFPVLSSYFSISFLIGINIATIVFIFLVFVFKDPQVYPTWGHWVIMSFILITNYFIFIRKRRYESILNESENLIKSERKKRDIVITIYLILTFLTFILVVNASRDLLIQKGVMMY